MGNEVVAVNPAENLPVHSLQEMDWLGKMVAGTQLFGQTKPADCLAIVAMCHQERMSWMRFSQTYHWIKGRPTKRTDAILADFAKIGGKKKVHERTPDRASCTFALDGDEYTSSISWEDARREPFVYDGRESDVVVALANGGRYPNGAPLALKAKYQTPRARMQMLWARCVSDGVRTVAPQCWLSAEPLLGPLDLHLGYIAPEDLPFKWIVVGCESGPSRRPCKIEWVESIVGQAMARDVPVFVKQLDINGMCETDIAKFPAHLRIRQVPWEGNSNEEKK